MKKQKVILALGGNLGDVRATFSWAINELTRHDFVLIGQSKIIETTPVGCPVDTPNFLNMAIIGYTTFAPTELLKVCQKIEIASGRPVEHGKNLSRTLDIDIIAISDYCIALPNLVIPHPRALDRSFVMEPLGDLETQKLFERDEFKELYR